MTATCVNAAGLAKKFAVRTGRKSALRSLQAFARRTPITRDHWVLRDLSFTLCRGDKLALLGGNGSGKTTLLRILSGIYRASAGELHIATPPRALFDCSSGFIRDLPVGDNVFLFAAVHGMRRSFVRPQLAEILAEAGVAHLEFAPLKDLSKGQIQRLALTVFARTTDEFLIFDEVLGNVDLGFQRHAESYFSSLASSHKTLIMTSHDGELLRRHCTTALWLDRGTARRAGPFADVLAEYEASFARSR